MVIVIILTKTLPSNAASLLQKIVKTQNKIVQKPLRVCDVLILNQHDSNTKNLTSMLSARGILLVSKS